MSKTIISLTVFTFIILAGCISPEEQAKRAEEEKQRLVAAEQTWNDQSVRMNLGVPGGDVLTSLHQFKKGSTVWVVTIGTGSSSHEMFETTTTQNSFVINFSDGQDLIVDRVTYVIKNGHGDDVTPKPFFNRVGHNLINLFHKGFPNDNWEFKFQCNLDPGAYQLLVVSQETGRTLQSYPFTVVSDN